MLSKWRFVPNFQFHLRACPQGSTDFDWSLCFVVAPLGYDVRGAFWFTSYARTSSLLVGSSRVMLVTVVVPCCKKAFHTQSSRHCEQRKTTLLCSTKLFQPVIPHSFQLVVVINNNHEASSCSFRPYRIRCGLCPFHQVCYQHVVSSKRWYHEVACCRLSIILRMRL